MLALRCGVVLVLLIGLASAEIKNKGWWKNTVFYQIYPRSFKDSNDDGIGDLKGIADKMEYFKDLGIGAIWLSPIFASPMVDFGYDISDFRKIHEEYGTLADFKYLTKKAKNLKIKVVLDLVPNHSSDKHEWFQNALKGDEKYLKYYIFSPLNKAAPNKPPNNWLSVFGGSAWTKVNITKNNTDSWYFHQFDRRQPDLNYANNEVRVEMQDIIKFWLDKGVDGFRVDAVPHLFEDEQRRDEAESHIPGMTANEYNYLNHTYTKDDPRAYELVGEWRKVLDTWANERNEDEKVMMTEAYTSPENTVKFYKFGSNVPFNFKFITDVNSNSTPEIFKKSIDDWMMDMEKVGKDYVANWVMGNHDNSRIATRYPGRGDQMVILGMILPGVAVTYYGEELGMEDLLNISFEDTQDPQGISAGKDKYKQYSRDPERSPFQWTSNNSTNAGFNDGAKTWLPVHENYKKINVESEIEDKTSTLNLYKTLVRLRKTSKALISGTLKTVTLNEKVLGVIRESTSDDKESVVLLMNFDDKEKSVNISALLNAKFKSAVVNVTTVQSIAAGTKVKLDAVKLPAKASFVLLPSNVPISDGKKDTSGGAQTWSISLAVALSSVVALALNSM